MPPADAPRGSTRELPRLLLVLAGLFLVLRVATALYERARPPETVELVTWAPIEEAVTRARQTARPILYDFTAEWCPPCRQMSREVFSDRASATQIQSLFVPVRVLDRQREEGRNAPEVAALQERFGVEAFPTLIVVPPDGGEPVKIEGYPGRDALMQQLTQAGTRSIMQLRMDPRGRGLDSLR